jgi:hypothetical protein
MIPQQRFQIILNFLPSQGQNGIIAGTSKEGGLDGISLAYL